MRELAPAFLGEARLARRPEQAPPAESGGKPPHSILRQPSIGDLCRGVTVAQATFLCCRLTADACATGKACYDFGFVAQPERWQANPSDGPLKHRRETLQFGAGLCEKPGTGTENDLRRMRVVAVAAMGAAALAYCLPRVRAQNSSTSNGASATGAGAMVATTANGAITPSSFAGHGMPCPY